MGRPRIHVLLDDNTLAPSVLDALRGLDAEVEVEVSPFDTTVKHSTPAPTTTRSDPPDKGGSRGSTAENRREHIHHIDDQLRLAASLQRNLHAPIPVADGLDIHTVYRPADIVSGDAYDVVRLDETHVAVTVADATGHGLPAGLLSTFVRRSLRGKELVRDGYRLLEPNEVLARANADILDTHLQECQFVTALYAVFDESTGIIRWARGGAPYPILVRPEARAKQIISRGPLLGAIGQARFEVMEQRLEPGDTILFHTDGLDALLLGQRRDLGCCDLDRTDWFETLGDEPIDTHLKRLETGPASVGGTTDWSRDDMTIVALHVREAATRKLAGAEETHQVMAVPVPA